MNALFVKIFAERNCGAAELGRDIRKAWHVTEMRGAPELDRASLRSILKSVPPRERAALHNHMLDTEHDRILYSDFGWSATAPSPDIIQSAAHAADTLFVGVTMHPAAFAAALNARPRTPGAATRQMPLPDWLAQPFPIHRRDGLGDEEPRLPLSLWTAKARALLKLADTDRDVVLLQATNLRETAEAALTPHMMRKDDAKPGFARIEVPNWEPALRRLPGRDLREFRLQLDDGIMRALGYDPL